MDLRDQWLHAYLAKELDRSPETVETYRKAANAVEVFCNKPVWTLTVRDVRRYLTESAHSRAQKHLCVAAVKSYHRFECLELDHPPNGLMALHAPRVPPAVRTELSVEQVRALCLVARQHPRDARAVYYGLFEGLRIGESVRTEVGADRLQVMGKGRKPREVPIHEEVAEVLPIIEQERPNRQALLYRIKTLRERTGIDFAGHDLRHTFGRRMRAIKCPHEVTKDIMGHGADQTSLYSPVTWDEKVEWFGRFYYGGQG